VAVVEPLPGDFALVRVSGPTGLLIRLGQGLVSHTLADYEHAFVYLGDGQLVEAEPGGVRVKPLSEYHGRNLMWSTGSVRLSRGQRVTIVAAAWAMKGRPYDYWDYPDIAAYHIPFLRRLLGLENRHRQAVICSQLVAETYNAAGVSLSSEPDRYVTPADLHNWLVRHN